jgi:4-diphosphocytidyl-2-C-methyl-D-erythritol kinase
MPRRLILHAPAKLNLALSVGPPGVDGMHPISSWMMKFNLFDDLTITRLEDDRLSRYAILWHREARQRSAIDWSITRDLAVRAHLTLERQLGRHLPLELKLEKRIPVGGGLGGGSSDAAAMLHAANQLFDLGLSVDELAATAGTLGSDVPFFVHDCGSAIIEGLGERVHRADRPDTVHVAVVFPEARCPTGDVYRAFDSLATGALNPPAVRELASQPRIASDELFNDLAAAAAAIAPGLPALRESVSALAQRQTHLSGSGSSFFVLCDDAMHAEALATSIESKLDVPALALQSCTVSHVKT